MNPESMNESEDPESTRDISWVSGMVSVVTGVQTCALPIWGCLGVESKAAFDPVNHWIVAGEPAVSEHEGTTQV